MPPPPTHQSRINLADLKSQIARKLGPERAQRYFSCLNRLLGQKLSKTEFDKQCFHYLGRENIPLHNQLIRGILRNAYQAKVPPPTVHNKDVPKPNRVVAKKSSPTDDKLHSSPIVAPTPPNWPNGDILPPSPRKVRSGFRDCRLKDRPSPLGPNGRADIMTHQPLLPCSDAVVRENGGLIPCDLKRPLQQHQAGLAEQPTRRPRTEKLSPHDWVSVNTKSPIDVIEVEDGEETRMKDLNSTKGPLSAPLGIPFCRASVGGAGRSLPLETSDSSSCFTSSYSRELCPTEALRKRMEHIAVTQGLGGVTMDCANLLNNGLDAYLKQLIRSCVQLTGDRTRQGSVKHPIHKQQPHLKIINGIWPGNHMHVQSSGGSLEGVKEMKSHNTISLLDFKVAMELNPQQLGEDWPLLLEKICFHSFDE